MNKDLDSLIKEIDKLKKEVALLRTKRIAQYDVIPGAIKKGAMGEANKYVSSGLLADIPAGENVNGSVIIYFATDNNKLYIWNGTAYKSVTLS